MSEAHWHYLPTRTVYVPVAEITASVKTWLRRNLGFLTDADFFAAK